MGYGVARFVSADRLGELLEALAQFGAHPSGGVARQAFCDAEIGARRFLVRRAQSLGCEAAQDAAGNLYFRRHGMEDLPAVATGSHIDTQPIGGKLDGAYGVCAALEVFAALNDADLKTRRPLDVVVWANEEGCRFAPGSMGSAAFVEPGRLPVFLSTADDSGILYGDCVGKARNELRDIALRPLGTAFAGFVELHIEQGPVLEGAGVSLGIVDGVQGVRWFRVSATGRAAHAGTTPLAHRQDAMRALCELMHALYAHAERNPQLRFTVGTIRVAPGAINTIPGEASISIDIRHVEQEPLGDCERLIEEYCASPRYGCRFSVEKTMELATTWFDEGVKRSLRGAVDTLGLKSLPMVSGAFHDAVHLANHCPTGMLFVPSRDGISHNSDEYTEPADLAAGTRVLALALVDLANASKT